MSDNCSQTKLFLVNLIKKSISRSIYWFLKIWPTSSEVFHHSICFSMVAYCMCVCEIYQNWKLVTTVLLSQEEYKTLLSRILCDMSHRNSIQRSCAQVFLNSRNISTMSLWIQLSWVWLCTFQTVGLTRKRCCNFWNVPHCQWIYWLALMYIW